MIEFLKYCIECLLVTINAALGYNPEEMTWKVGFVGILTAVAFCFIGYGSCWLITHIFISKYCLSRKLVKAIKAKQSSKIQIIVEYYPECIRVYPSLFPKNWNLIRNRKFRYPLTEVCSMDELNLVKLFLEKGADPNCNDGMTPLMVAAKNSTPEIIRLLLDYGADKNCKSNEGKTAYDYAVEFNRKDNIPLLEN